MVQNNLRILYNTYCTVEMLNTGANEARNHVRERNSYKEQECNICCHVVWDDCKSSLAEEENSAVTEETPPALKDKGDLREY